MTMATYFSMGDGGDGDALLDSRRRMADGGWRMATYFSTGDGGDGDALLDARRRRTSNRPTAQCWWCRYRTQTRDHLFKVCPERKAQQKILLAEVREESGKSRCKIRDLLADSRCGQPVLDFLSTTDVGRLVLAPAEEHAQSETSEWELRERREREEEREVEAEGLGAEVEEPLFLPTPAFMASAEEE
jgi:hypothetical protein